MANIAVDGVVKALIHMQLGIMAYVDALLDERPRTLSLMPRCTGNIVLRILEQESVAD